ncbi:hypothetical protein PV10_02082 [Exophiala mesophila]|uniref:DUF7730 domain-containing protein n=1 Tax=Exophiala mesophila TaxID=212818 RepID=A0A0D1WXW7_EXOME|nr:uncharacterized protein PV10_02082 [Exophiala mesophila]KIV94305.1 hypothetical protein PV10_02082 [Exophiala mesophila]
MASAPKGVSSYARPRKELRKQAKVVQFFDLPGEIRNKIYGMVVGHARVELSANHPNKQLAKAQILEPHAKHKRPRSRLLKHSNQPSLGRSMLFVCRQMHHEVIQLIYQMTTFKFNTMNAIHKFINISPSAGVSSIANIHVTHTGYAEPRYTDDRQWKLRHDAKWNATLTKIKASMPALQYFSLKYSFFDWPCPLDIDADWAKPLIKFAGDGIHRVDLVVEHDRYSDEKNKEVSRNLEKRMMTTNGWRAKIANVKRQAEMEKKKKERRNPPRILTIRLPLSTSTASPNVPPKKVVRSVGLEQYAIKDPPFVICH